jgi:transposase
MKAYSQDLRERVVRACDEGRGTRQQIADLFGVSTAWIRRLLQRRRATGSFAALPHGGGSPPKMDEERRGRLVLLVAQQPDATLEELRDRLAAPVHPCTISRTLARLGLPVKKKSFGPPSTTAPMSAASGRPGAAGPGTSTRTASSSWTNSGRIRR